MRVAVLNANGKADLLWKALADDPRFELVADHAEVLLADTEHPERLPQIQPLLNQGARLVLYPHGAAPQLEYDGVRRVNRPVWMQLVHGEGHAEVYRRIGHPVRTEVVGWTYTTARRPTEPASAGSVLFAPIHPWADGHTILPVHGEANRLAYEAFRQLEAPRKTVRYIGDLTAAGVFEQDPAIEYQDAATVPYLDAIDQADHILSYGTFAYTALARGKPVVMYGSDIPAMNDKGDTAAAHWDQYADYIRYPVDLTDGDLPELLRVRRTDAVVEEWCRLFVGEPFQPDTFRDLIYSLRPSRADRRRLERAAH